MSQQKIPFMQIRGGSSKGVYFKATDLPANEAERDRMLLSAMEGVGRGDLRQIDGLGGADSLTAKVAVISESTDDRADLDYLFLQVVLGEGRLTSVQGCGNILAGVLHFAIETGMVTPTNPVTTKVIRMLNGDGLCEMSVRTPGGQIQIEGSAKVDGVPGTGAPIICNYLDTAGSNCVALFPTGNLVDVVNGIEVTCIDDGMPVVHMRATDLGITGYEDKATLDKNESLKQQLETIRLAIGPRMNLGDVSNKTVPKMCLLSPPIKGGVINTRTFIPKVCHAAIGVMSAFSTAVCAVTKGTISDGMVDHAYDVGNLSLEHPSGEFTVSLALDGSGIETKVVRSGAIRTARIISKGEVYIV